MLVPEVSSSTPNASDQRTERRIRVRIPAHMRQVYPCVLERVPILILEESPSGAAILSPSQIYQGSLIQIMQNDFIRLAEVRYCVRFQESYRIGLRVKACHHAR